MKQYIYEPSVAGLAEWPSGTLRLQGIEVTENPNEADVFVCPGSLANFQNPLSLNKFPFMMDRESRHVFFDVSDFETQYGKSCIFIRCNTRDWYFRNDPNTLSFPWPVEDYEDCVELPGNGFKYDVSFHGWLSSPTRKAAFTSCNSNIRLNCDFAGYADFCGYIFDKPEGIRRRKEFRRSMRESRLALCPQSIPGVFPYRFFEALSAGRVPILVCSGCVFPFADRIPYEKFILHCEVKDAHLVGEMAADFLTSHTDNDLVEMGILARKYWIEFLNSKDWPARMAEEVVLKMKALGLTV